MRRSFVAGSWIVLALLLLVVTSALEFMINTQSAFDQGTYNATLFNATSGSVHLNLSLSSLNVSMGTYTSPVFNAGRNATWTSFALTVLQPIRDNLFAVDGAGGVYMSRNAGINWTQRVSDYGGGSNTRDMMADEDYVYIIFSNAAKELYRSSTLGSSWIIVNDTISTNSLQKGTIDHQGNIYIVSSNGNIYLSTNKGATWTLQGDFNGGASAVPQGIDVNGTDALYIADGNEDVWVSTNSGVTWTRQTTNYGGGGTADGLAAANSSVYILFNKQVFRSTNSGINWTLINSSISPYSQNGLDIFISRANVFYIVDEAERVFKSTDEGFTWKELSDFNGGAGNDEKGFTTFTVETNLTYQVRACSLATCSDASFKGPDGTSTSYYQGSQNLQVNTSQYFQYRIVFWGQDLVLTPELFNITLQYSLLQTPTSVILMLNGTSSNLTVAQNTIVDINGTLVNAVGMLNLTIDAVQETSGLNTLFYQKNFTSNGTFAVGLWYYGDENSTASNATYYVTVIGNQSGGSPALTSSAVNLTLNGTSGNITLQQSTLLNISGFLINASGMLNLSIGNVFEASGIDILSYMKNFTSNGTFAISLFYFGNSTTMASNATYYALVTVEQSGGSGSNQTNQTGGGSSGGSSSSSSGPSFSPNTGNSEFSSKYRGGEAPTTSQRAQAATPTPSAPASTPISSQPSAPSTGGLAGITGAAVRGPSSSLSFLDTLLSPGDKALGLVFFILVLTALVLHISKRIRQGEEPLLQYFKRRISLRSPPQHRSLYIKNLQKTYQKDSLSRQLEQVNKDHVFKQPPQRNIKIQQPLLQNVQRTKAGKAVVALKEVYKL